MSSYSVFVERQIVLVNRYRIPLDDLPPAFHDFTIAHLTDLHLGYPVSVAFIEEIVQRTNRLNADTIVSAGDYVHERNTVAEIDRVWPILNKLRAKDGVYSVLGNHDHWADTQRSLYWQERSGQGIRHHHHAIYRGKQRPQQYRVSLDTLRLHLPFSLGNGRTFTSSLTAMPVARGLPIGESTLHPHLGKRFNPRFPKKRGIKKPPSQTNHTIPDRIGYDKKYGLGRSRFFYSNRDILNRFETL